MSNVEEVKSRLPIEEVVGSYLELKHAGKNLKGVCPFHSEKSPSFFVSPERDSYYCFGCGAKGDIFTFVQEFEGVDFKQALKMLADQAGVELSFEQGEDKSKHDIYFEILEHATKFFQEQLILEKKAQKYLEERGLTKETIKEWRIGYIPHDWRILHDVLLSKGYGKEDIETVGLIKESDSGNKWYDRFRGRIMFPIFDSMSRVVAFSGRIFDDGSVSKDDLEKAAKYLNSPETPLFNKSELLYGYHRAKTGIRKNDFAILVEGQFDVVLTHQAGYGNAVAVSGTSLTEQHVRLLNRITSKLVIALDSDNAGIRASEKAWNLALMTGMDVKVAVLPEGKDPADVITKNVEDWKHAIRDAKHVIEFLAGRIHFLKKDSRTKIVHVTEELVPYIARIPRASEQSHFVDYVASEFGIDREALWQDVKSFDIEKEKEVSTKRQSVIPQQSAGQSVSPLIKQTVSLLFWKNAEKNKSVHFEKFEKDIFEILGKPKLEKMLSAFEAKKDEFLFEIEAMYEDDDVLKKDLEELPKRFRIEVLKKEREDLQAKLSEDSDNIHILERIQEISKEVGM